MRYPAIVIKEGDAFLIEFPDCPGCQTFARTEVEIESRAAEALEAWLEVSLEDGIVPREPSSRIRLPRGAERRDIPVPVGVGAALAIRQARQQARLSQAALGQKIGVTQQAIAKLENARGNITLDTLEKVARGLGREVELQLR